MFRKLLPTLAALMFVTAAGAQQAPAPSPDMKRGKLLYIQCRACHELKAGGPQLVGPNLSGVFGRKAAAAPGFNNYSAALRKSDIVWNAQTLDKWLAQPASMVPGNTMAFPGISNAKDRAALIAYIEAETKPAKP